MDVSLIRYNDAVHGGAFDMLRENYFSDKEISRREREILDSQLETEDLFAWRKNILAQGGGQPGIQVVGQTARVRGHEPVLKVSDNKDEQDMYNRVTKKYEKARKRTDKEARKRQKAYRSMYSAFEPIRVNQISSKPQFEILAKAAHLIEGEIFFHEEEKRAAMRKMYSNLQLGCEMEASYQNQLLAYELIVKDAEIMNDPAMLAETQRRIGVLQQQRELAHQWVDDLFGTIRYVTGNDLVVVDGSLTDRGKDMTLVKKFYGERFHKRYDNSEDTVAVQQRDYIKDIRLIRQEPTPEDEPQTAEGKMKAEMEMRAYYNELNDFSIENYAAMGNRELMERMRDLQAVGINARRMRILGSRQLSGLSETEQDRTVLSAYCDESAQEEVLMVYRMRMAELCAQKARILWYIEALHLRKLDADDIHPDDRWYAEVPRSGEWQPYGPLERMLAVCNENLHRYLELYRSQKAQM